jgi:hypothetical protein
VEIGGVKMSVLAKLKANKNKATKQERPRAYADAQQQVTPRYIERPTSLAACARLYRQYDKQIKSMQRMADELKKHVRQAGVEAMREAEQKGEYYGMAQVGCCKVVRQNKYRPVDVGRQDLIGAVGSAEYGVLFNESVVIELDSYEQLMQAQEMCKLAGFELPGVPVVQIKPKSGFIERKCELLPSLKGEQREVVEEIASGEQAPSVSWK